MDVAESDKQSSLLDTALVMATKSLIAQASSSFQII